MNKQQNYGDLNPYKNYLENAGVYMSQECNNAVDARKLEYLNYFEDLALSMFEWPDMGEFFDASFAERCLFSDGWVLIWYDSTLKSALCGKLVPNGNLDMYGGFERFEVYTPDGKRFENKFTRENSVVVFNDLMRGNTAGYNSSPYPPARYLYMIAEEMAVTRETKMQNLISMGTPTVIVGTQKQRQTMIEKLQKFMRREHFIMVDSEVSNAENIKALDTGVQCWLPQLDDTFERTKNEGLTYLGINNSVTDKKERMIVDEVNSNNVQISTIAASKLEARQNAIEQYNRIFGTSFQITLRPTSTQTTEYKDAPETENEEEEGDD